LDSREDESTFEANILGIKTICPEHLSVYMLEELEEVPFKEIWEKARYLRTNWLKPMRDTRIYSQNLVMSNMRFLITPGLVLLAATTLSTGNISQLLVLGHRLLSSDF